MLNRIPATIRNTTNKPTSNRSSSSSSRQNRRQALDHSLDTKIEARSSNYHSQAYDTVDAISSLERRQQTLNVPLVHSQSLSLLYQTITKRTRRQQGSSAAKLTSAYSHTNNNLIPTVNLITTTTKLSPPVTMATNLRQHIYYQIAASILILVALLASTTSSLFLTDSLVSSKLQSFKVYPDILDSYSLDLLKLEANGNTIRPGDMVPAKNFRSIDMNKVSWDSSDSDRYTLIIVDLDRKSATNNSQMIYNQFTSINIPGHAINLGQAITAYEPPNVPCQPSIKHRILALACYQSQNIDIVDAANIAASTGQSAKRENFKLKSFLHAHQLSPAAANIFHAMGEANGVCSGSSSSIHSIQNLTSILIAMVMLSGAWRAVARSQPI